MPRARRQISLALALVMVITSVLNVLFVSCFVETDHHGIELIGHQLPGEVGEPGHGADLDLHVHGCADVALLADTATPRSSPACLWFDADQAEVALRTMPASSDPLRSPPHDLFVGPPDEPMRRPATDDLATVRLLI